MGVGGVREAHRAMTPLWRLAVVSCRAWRLPWSCGGLLGQSPVSRKGQVPQHPPWGQGPTLPRARLHGAGPMGRVGEAQREARQRW